MDPNEFQQTPVQLWQADAGGAGGTVGAGAEGAGSGQGGGQADTALGGGDGGTVAPNGVTVPLESLPEEFRQNSALTPHIKEDKVDVNGLTKSFINAQSMLGADKVVLPKEDAPREQWDTVFNKLGRPEKPEGYELPTKFDEAPRFEMGEEAGEFFRQAFHDVGLSKTQANELLKRYAKWESDAMDAADQQIGATREQELEAIDKTFGEAKEQEIAVAKQAVAWVEQKVPGFKDWLNQTGMGDRAMLIQAFNLVGKAMGDDTLGPAVRRMGGGAMTPAAAQRELAELRKDPAFMGEGARKDPHRHREIVQKIMELSEMTDPNAEVIIHRTDRQVGAQ